LHYPEISVWAQMTQELTGSLPEVYPQ